VTGSRKRKLRGEPFCKKVPPRTPLQKLLYAFRLASSASGEGCQAERYRVSEEAGGKLFHTRTVGCGDQGEPHRSRIYPRPMLPATSTLILSRDLLYWVPRSWALPGPCFLLILLPSQLGIFPAPRYHRFLFTLVVQFARQPCLLRKPARTWRSPGPWHPEISP